MTEGKRKTCQLCDNCDLEGHCMLKENIPFFECEHDEHYILDREVHECFQQEAFDKIKE